jgi:hypothetical protein
MRRPLSASLIVGSLLVALGAGCRAKPQQFSANVKLEKLEIDQRDAQGNPLTVDLTLEFPDCPGDQVKTVRGGAEFAKCLTKVKVGDVVPAKLDWGPVPDGYDFEVEEIGGCARPHDPDDESSHEIIQVCQELEAHGVKVGFHCDRKPSRELLEKCPYFRVR